MSVPPNVRTYKVVPKKNYKGKNCCTIWPIQFFAIKKYYIHCREYHQLCSR